MRLGHAEKGKDKSGRVRIHCNACAVNGTCPEPATFHLDSVEFTMTSDLEAQP